MLRLVYPGVNSLSLLGRGRGSVELSVPKASGVAWSPLALSPLIWLDATQLSGLANNDPVAEFTDFSGNGNHFVQASTINKPTFKAVGINGLASVESDGVDDDMTLTGVGSQAAWSAFLVFKQTVADTTENTFWSIADYPSAANYKMLEKVAGPDGGANLNINGSPSGAALSPYYTAGDIAAILVIGTNGSLSIKDQAGNTGLNPSGNHSRADDVMRLFNRGDPRPAPAQIGELLFFDRSLSTGDETTLWAYSAAKWGHTDPS